MTGKVCQGVCAWWRSGGLFASTMPVVAAGLPLLLLFSSKGMVVLFGLAVLAAMVDLLGTGGWRRPGLDGGVVLALALVLAWGLASGLWEETPGLAVAKTGQLVTLGVGALILVAAARRQPELVARRSLSWLCGGLLLTTLVIGIEAAFNLPIGRTLRGLPSNSPALSILYYKNVAAAGAVLVVPATCVALAWRRWLMAAVLAVSLVFCARATHSYTSIVAITVAVACLLPALRWPRVSLALVAVLMLGLFTAAPLASRLPDTNYLVRSVPWLPPSLMHRTAIWQFVASHVIERPLLGWGLDASRELPGGDANITMVAMYRGALVEFNQQILPLHPHNMALQLWLETGAVGVMLFLALLTALLRRVLAWPGRMVAVATAAVVTPLIVGMASYGLWQSWWLSCVALMASLVATWLPACAEADGRSSE